MKRITCIAVFDKNSINKIKNFTQLIDEKLCKVPFSEKYREKNDTLPYHITLQSWNQKEKAKIKEKRRY